MEKELKHCTDGELDTMLRLSTEASAVAAIKDEQNLRQEARRIYKLKYKDAGAEDWCR